jgi:phage gp29-like protein
MKEISQYAPLGIWSYYPMGALYPLGAGYPYLFAEEVNIWVYWAMYRSDPTVRAGVEFIRNTILSRLVGYKNETYPEVQLFVENVLEAMQGTLQDVVQDLLSALWAGFSVAEIVYKPLKEEGKIGIKKVKAINPISVYGGIEVDEFGNIQKIKQRVGTEAIDLPLERLILWSFQSDFGNPYGNSLLRPAYVPWMTKIFLQQRWNIHLERLATPLTIASLPQAEVDVWCPIHQREERYIEAMRHILEDLHNRNSLVYSGGADIKFQEIEGRGDFYENAIRYQDVLILRALLIPSLLVSEAQYGTRAQATVHQEVFQKMLGGIIRELKAVLEEQLFRRLISLNFGQLDDWGEVVFDEPIEPQPIIDAVFRLYSVGAMHWTTDDENILRQALHLPPYSPPTPTSTPMPKVTPPATEETYPPEVEEVPPEGRAR